MSLLDKLNKLKSVPRETLENKIVEAVACVVVAALVFSFIYKTKKEQEYIRKNLAQDAVAGYNLEIYNKDIDNDGKIDTILGYRDSRDSKLVPVLKIERNKNKNPGWKATPLYSHHESEKNCNLHLK